MLLSLLEQIYPLKSKKKKKKPPTFYKAIEEEKGTKNVFYRDLLSNMNKNGYFLQYANLKDETLDIVIQNSQYEVQFCYPPMPPI